MKILFKNKRAYFDYDILQEYEAGIVLKGYEVKALKLRMGSINEAIIKVQGKDLYIINMLISSYPKATNIGNYNPKRPRKLLLHKKEIAKIVASTTKTGNTIILLEIYLNYKNLIKAKIAVGKLRKKIEKKQILKERDIDKQMQKEIKNLALS